ncbi:MAG: hypothetical protein HEQ16_02935 [Bosea sp.]|jgi:hypothetical protein|nr:hypothetical protein [Bosea sp. (in: a-proteobacteria)]
MKTLRLALLAAAAAFTLTAVATAQTPAPQDSPQIEETAGGCGWKSKSAATS